MSKIVLQTIIQTEINTLTNESRILRQWTTIIGAPPKKKPKKEVVLLTTGKETKREI